MVINLWLPLLGWWILWIVKLTETKQTTQTITTFFKVAWTSAHVMYKQAYRKQIKKSHLLMPVFFTSPHFMHGHEEGVVRENWPKLKFYQRYQQEGLLSSWTVTYIRWKLDNTWLYSLLTYSEELIIILAPWGLQNSFQSSEIHMLPQNPWDFLEFLCIITLDLVNT